MSQDLIREYEQEIAISGNEALVDRELARFYPQAANVREYENQYFDGDPDRYERLAEEAEWQKKTITPGSIIFEYRPECPLCAEGSMHDFDQHYAAQLADRKRREEAQARFIAACAEDPHPF